MWLGSHGKSRTQGPIKGMSYVHNLDKNGLFKHPVSEGDTIAVSIYSVKITFFNPKLTCPHITQPVSIYPKLKVGPKSWEVSDLARCCVSSFYFHKLCWVSGNLLKLI